MLLLVGLVTRADAQINAAAEALQLARDGRPDSALALLVTARSKEPGNLDLQVAQARVLGWAGRRREAEAVFDSVLARSPTNTDAMIGLGYLYHWEGREREGTRQAEAALALDSTNSDARSLLRALHTAVRASMESTANWSNDSDENTSFWQTHSISVGVGGGVRLLGGLEALEASDPVREAWRFGGEAGLAWTGSRVNASARLGARSLRPAEGGSRTSASYRGIVSWAPDPAIGLGIGYARHSLDETALLIGLGLDLESLEAGLDLHPAGGLTVSAGASGMWVSDGNHRTDGRAAVLQEVGKNLIIGANARALGYRDTAFGYFSPGRFHQAEGTATLKTDDALWVARLGGGLGAQQIGRHGDAQTEWHVEARVGRKWGDGNIIEVFGGLTNSAVSSTTGAFRYRTAGLRLNLGL